MRNDIDPLPIPTQDATPHFIRLIDAYFALEIAHDAPEHDAPATLDRIAIFVQNQFVRGIVLQGVDAGFEKAADDVGPRHVEVGEVGGIGFVEIVIALPEGGVGGGYAGEEEGCRAEVGGDVWDGEDEMFEDGIPDSELGVLAMLFCKREGGGRGTHMPYARQTFQIR